MKMPRSGTPVPQISRQDALVSDVASSLKNLIERANAEPSTPEYLTAILERVETFASSQSQRKRH